MTDYGRVPQMDLETNVKEEEKEVFEVKEKEPVKEVSKEDEKKIKLREHLARCREKSAKVRAEKKAERIANKKPRGRPKKVKESNLDMSVKPIEEISTPEPIPPKEVEVFNQEKKRIETIEIPQQIETPKAPASNSMFDMDMLLNKIDERMDTRLKNFKPPPQQSYHLPPQNYYQPQPQINEQQIREDERKRMKDERDRKKQEVMNQRTQRYYNKLPPVSFVSSDNPWDNLLNPKRYG